MKIEDILRIEHNNVSNIQLFNDGIFFRAYERSAMLFNECVTRYKVFKKFYYEKHITQHGKTSATPSTP